MKKHISKIAVIVATIIFTLSLSGCNKQILDLNYKFDRAIVIIGGEPIEMNIKSWRDYEDGDQIQITSEDGTTYLVHSMNITLISN